MITDYNRGQGSGNDNDLNGLSSLKAMGGNMKKLSSSYASAKSMFDTAGLNDMINSASSMEKGDMEFTGGIELGEAGKFLAGSVSAGGGGNKPNAKSSNLFQDLIDLILGIIQIPERFGHLFMGTIHSTEMLAKGISGFFQSAALGINDIVLMIFAFIKIVAKYWMCILSFIVTLAPCFVIHIITAICFVIYYWLIYVPISGIDRVLGTSSMKTVDKALSFVWWPKPISMLCYSCFGKPVKLSDILDDIEIFSELGDKMNSDFNVTIPRYMRPAVAPAKRANREINAAFD